MKGNASLDSPQLLPWALHTDVLSTSLADCLMRACAFRQPERVRVLDTRKPTPEHCEPLDQRHEQGPKGAGFGLWLLPASQGHDSPRTRHPPWRASQNNGDTLVDCVMPDGMTEWTQLRAARGVPGRWANVL